MTAEQSLIKGHISLTIAVVLEAYKLILEKSTDKSNQYDIRYICLRKNGLILVLITV